MRIILSGFAIGVLVFMIFCVFNAQCQINTAQPTQPFDSNAYKRRQNNIATLISTYPPTTLATEVWNWGQATGDYESEIQGDTYVAGTGGNAGHLYEQTGPNASLNAVYWRNSASHNSHHTSPGTTSGQSNGAVNANMKPGLSSFKFYFLMKSVNGPDSAYTFFDYDQQSDQSTFIQGMQFFVATAGLFAPCSLVAIIKDGTGNLAEYHAKTGGTRLFEDNTWHLVEMIFDRTQALPTYKIDGQALLVQNTFAGPALSALTAIEPADGIRFGMREYSETAITRADLQMVAAAYSKNLAYQWRP